MSATQKRFTDVSQRASRDLDVSHAAVAVMKASSAVTRAIERALSEVELTLPKFNVLMELAASPDAGLAMHELTGKLVSTPANLSWLTTRMRDKGLVTKERDAEDARVVRLVITETGWAALQEAMPRVFDAEKLLFQGSPKSDLRALVKLLEPLLE